MNLLQTFRIAVWALARNKLRAFLTTLGVVIGVGAVIAMVAIGEGAKSQVEQSFASMGSNLLIILPGTSTAGGAQGGFGSQPTLTWDDLRAIRDEIGTVRSAAAAMRATAQVLSEDQNWTTSVVGTTPEYFDVRGWRATGGRLIEPPDVEAAARICVLGQTVVERLFGPDADPVGTMVRIKNAPFEVVGVLERKGQSPMGQDYDDTVLVPAPTFLSRIQTGLPKYISGIVFVSATSTADTARAQTQITGLLRDRHHIAPGTDDDFSIRNLTEMASAQQEGTRTLTTLLASIAAVSLLVGGIGIMNIMLVSVTERTREIGLRMALGARPRDILAQFLVESLLLAVVGGGIGVGLGVLAARQLADTFHWPLLIKPEVVTLAVGFSGLVGVGFGLYPARRASQLDPIEALRSE